MTTALIVIDAQQSFFAHRPYVEPAEVPAYLAAQNRLIEGFQAAGPPIVRVFHVQPDASRRVAGHAFWGEASGALSAIPHEKPKRPSGCGWPARKMALATIAG